MGETRTFRSMAGLMALGACGIGLMVHTGFATAAGAPATDRPATTAGSAAANGVVIGAFDGKAKTSSRSGTYVPNDAEGAGWGWVATNDQRAGGKSTASIALVHPGADGTGGALQATGELKPGFIAPWAGAVWFPGSRPMQPADLSGRKELVFRARGKPGRYSIMMMTGSARSIPLYASFTVTKEWKEYTIPLARSFIGADLRHVYMIAFSVGDYGKFQFELDKVALH